MKLRINDFGGNHNTESFELKVEKLDDIELVGALTIKGSVTKKHDLSVGDVFIVSGSYSGKIKAECVRCLKEITQDIDGTFNWSVLDPKSYSVYLKSLDEESEIDSEGFEEALNGEIDIIELVRQQILLDQDLYPTCQPSCSDESHIEKYSNNGIDPRWAKLLDIDD